MKDALSLLIGNTPLIELATFSSNARIFAKAEWVNLTGSVKDRPALKILVEAQKNGLKQGACVIEATSGNMGISFAAIAKKLGFRAVIVMPENMSEERKSIIRAYGAELVETPKELGMSGAVAMAEKLCCEREGSFMPRQFENPLNALAHYETTAPEIYAQTEKNVSAFVAGIGTGGTISGIARYLKEQNSLIKIVGVEPKSSPLLSEGHSGAHKIQGIGANFVPTVLDRSLLDEVITVSDDEAFDYARMAAKNEGIMCGISSGAALCAATKLANRAEMKGKTIVTLLPDSGIKYLSMGLYKSE